MIVNSSNLLSETQIHPDVIIVGAGPAGITCALELAARGKSVALIESGGRNFSQSVQALGDAHSLDPKRHAPLNISTRRQVGGASVIWGGRCLPFDPIDFEDRPWIAHSSWPVPYAELQPHFTKACEYFFCGKPIFSSHELDELPQKTIAPNLPDGDVRSSELERWSLPTNFGKEYYNQLRTSKRITLITGLTITEICLNQTGERVEFLHGRTIDGRDIRLRSSDYVLACGGLETTRLLLSSDRTIPGGIGNHSGLLGKFYMGHLSGRIAKIRFTCDRKQTAWGYWRDRSGVYVRPRFTFSANVQRRNCLTNVALWLANPTIGDPSHGNGVLSFAYLALSSRFGKHFASEAIRQAAIADGHADARWQHVLNMLRDLPSTARFIPEFAIKRFLLWRKAPGFFQPSRTNVYLLHFHGEQVPNSESRVSLSDVADAVGMRQLDINLQFTEQDVDSIIQTHELLDTHLRAHDAGQLAYLSDNLREHVWAQATDGFHQAGTTRMSVRPEDGVVDENCRIHGVDNLHIASSSVFVTSGQANSTFMIVVFALRLVDQLVAVKRTAVLTPSAFTADK